MRAVIFLQDEYNSAFTLTNNDQLKSGRDNSNDLQIKSIFSYSHVYKESLQTLHRNTKKEFVFSYM